MSSEVTATAVDSAQHLRLECLRMVYRHDKDEQTLIDRARTLEAYVIGNTSNATPAAQVARARQGKAAPG